MSVTKIFARAIRRAIWNGVFVVLAALLVAPAHAQSGGTGGICDRTRQVQDEIVRVLKAGAVLDADETCMDVTDADLEGITSNQGAADFLFLRNKSITALQSGDFAGLANLNTLWLHRNSLSALPADLFAGLAKLDTLFLYENTLATVPENVFSELTALTTLDMADNSLTFLPSNAFASLSFLTTLDLSNKTPEPGNNTLSFLPENVFSGLDNLTALDLRNNTLSALPADVFAELAELNRLDLSENLFETLAANAFAGLGKLHTLILNSNSLATLSADAFADLAKLEVLNLSENSLETLPAEGFADLAELKTLGLNDNSLETVPVNALAGLKGLETLNLQNNSLATLPANVFADLAELETLNLSDNSLTTLPVNSLAGLAGLETLNLQDNSLATLPVGAFNGLSPDTLQITGIGNLPAPPGEIRLTAQNGALRAEWDAVSVTGGVQYQVRWKPEAAATFAPEDAVAVSRAGYTIMNLVNDTAYEVRVAAVPARPQQTSSLDLAAWRSTARRSVPRAAPIVPGAPRMPAVYPDDRQLRITWTPPPDDDGSTAVTTYHLRWKPQAATTFAPADSATVNASAHVYDIAGLANGAAYEAQVAAENTAGVGPYSAAMQGIPRTVPGAPQSVTVSSDSDLLRVAWLPPADNGGAAVSAYHLRWKPPAETTFAPADSAAVGAALRAYVIENLESGATYEVQVAAENPAGAGAYAVAVQSTVLAGVCDRTMAVQDEIVRRLKGSGFFAPDKTCQDVTGTALLGIASTLDLSNKSISSLKAGDFAGLAKVTRLTLDNNALTTVPANAFAGLTSLSELSLSDNSLATFPVGAFNGLLPGSLLIKGIGRMFARPGAVRLTPQNRALRAEWDAVSVTGGAHYQVRWKLAAAAAFAPADAAAVDATGYTITGLDNGAAYEVRVAAVPSAPQQQFFSQGTWSATAAQSTLGNAPPEAPQDLRATAGNARIDIAWDAPKYDGGSPVSAYEVRWKLLTDSMYAAASTAAGSTSYAIENLTNDTGYEVEVAARNAEGISRYATVEVVPRVIPTAPSMPQSVMADISGILQLRITWTPPVNSGTAPVTTYHLRWKPQAEADFMPSDSAAVDAPARDYEITGLANGITYEVQVAAENSVAQGAWSESAQGVPCAFDLDVDDSGAATAADGIMVARYLLGVTAGGLTTGQSDAGNSADIAEKILCGINSMALDADGNGGIDHIDGFLVARYMLGLRGNALVAPFDVDAGKVVEKLDLVMPQAL